MITHLCFGNEHTIFSCAKVKRKRYSVYLHKMHILYVHMHAYVGGLRAGRSISIMPFVLSVSHQGVGAGINMQPAYLSSAAHLEPAFVYKGEVCTGKSVFHSSQREYEGKGRHTRVNFRLICCLQQVDCAIMWFGRLELTRV